MLNTARELFLVLFSILYGVMLQSISGLQPFPLGRTLRGYVKRDGIIETEFEETGECGQKSIEWLKRMWTWRILSSVVILNLGPIVYFWFILNLLNNDTLHAELASPNLLLIGIIFWSALGVFGFYRVYHWMAVKYWRNLFCDIVKRFDDRGVSFDAKAHLFWGIFIYILPGPFCLWLLNMLPWVHVSVIIIIYLVTFGVAHKYHKYWAATESEDESKYVPYCIQLRDQFRDRKIS